MVLDTSGFLGGSYFRWLKFSEVTINATRRTLHGRTIKGFTRFQEDSKDSQDSNGSQEESMARLRLAVQTPVGRLTTLTPFHVAPLVDGHLVQCSRRAAFTPQNVDNFLSTPPFQYKYYMAPTGSVLVPCRIRSYPIFPCVGH